MAHALAETNGRTTMMYYGETPWHRLGTKLDEPATAKEAITAAGLDYQVDLKELVTNNDLPVPQRKAVVRNDTSQVLGVVGNGYVPIQNAECFSFLDAVVTEGSVRYHTAGALGKGERIWMLAKLPGNIRIKGTKDITDKYLLLSNSHNGKSALRVFFTPIRVVCANTLSIAASGGRGQGISILHKGDLVAKVREAQKVLGLAARFYDDVQVKADYLARRYPTQKQLAIYFKQLFPDPEVGNKTRACNTRHRLHELFENGKGQNILGVRHTSWAAYNAVTEFVDHQRPTRARSEPERTSRRLQSQWFGSGAWLKAQAWSMALEMTDNN